MKWLKDIHNILRSEPSHFTETCKMHCPHTTQFFQSQKERKTGKNKKMKNQKGRKRKKKEHTKNGEIKIKKNRAWSYQKKFSGLRNFQKKSSNFKPTIFVLKVRKII
jgi:hypothetical protein